MERESEIRDLLLLDLRLIGAEEIDEADMDQITRSLQQELEEISAINEVVLPPSEAPESGSMGAKGLGETLGKLLLNLKSEGIPAVFQFLKVWVNRPGSRPLKIKAKGKTGEIEVEFDPETITAKKVQEMALALQSVLNQ